MTSAPVGAIDLGTNTALLLVARETEPGGFEVVLDHCLTPRLGAGLAERGTLDQAAVERALEALATFARRLAELNVDARRTRVVSTAVLRRARDAQAFVELARARTGLSIEIVSGEEEARLGEIAVAAEGVSRDTVVVDVGGGSTEVSCAALGFRHSLPLGAVVLAESSPPERYLDLATRAAEALPRGLAAGRDVVVLGGTGVNLACLALRFTRFDHEAAEGARVETSEARRWAERLAATQLEDRYALPIERERAGILPAGLSVLAAVLERSEAKSFRATGRGLRFGVARELLARERG